MRENKCKGCGENLSDITAYHTINGGVRFSLNHDNDVFLFVCINTSCGMYGILQVQSSCPDRLTGHKFVQCDEHSSTCTCGEVL